MYISSNIANRIKEMAKFRKIPIGKILTECNLGINTVSQLQGEKDILSKNLAKIADYLDCSVDYLLGRTDVPQINKASEYSQSVLNAANNGDEFNTKPFTPEQEAYIDKLIEKNNEKI